MLRLNPARLALCTATLAALAGTGRAEAAASLVGDTIQRVSQPQLTGVVGDPQFAVVQDPGFEYIDSFQFSGDFRRIDIGPDYIRMENLSSWFSPWFNSGFAPTYVEFRDLDFDVPGVVIGGVQVSWSSTIGLEDNAPIGYPLFGAHAVTWNADTIRLQIGPYSFPEGSFVHIQILTIPAPGAGAVALAGGLLALRRRRR